MFFFYSVSLLTFFYIFVPAPSLMSHYYCRQSILFSSAFVSCKKNIIMSKPLPLVTHLYLVIFPKWLTCMESFLSRQAPLHSIRSARSRSYKLPLLTKAPFFWFCGLTNEITLTEGHWGTLDSYLIFGTKKSQRLCWLWFFQVPNNKSLTTISNHSPVNEVWTTDRAS